MSCVALAYAERDPEHRRYYNGVTESLGILKRSNLYYCLLHRANSQLTARDTIRYETYERHDGTNFPLE